MKKLITILTLSLTLSSCNQEKNCGDFKTGKFIYAEKDRHEIVVRIEDFQIETNHETGIEIHSIIEWESECVYIMTYEKILNHPRDVSDVIGKKIFVEIIETSKNRIKVRAKSDRIDEEIEFIKME